MMPFEASKGTNPYSRCLKVFGFVCYTHFPNANRGKIYSKVELYILLGYNTVSKRYKEYNISTKKVFINRSCSGRVYPL